MKLHCLTLSILLLISTELLSQKTTSYRYNPSREGSRGFVVDYTIYYKVIDAYGVYYSLSFDGTIDKGEGYLFEGKLYSESDIPGLFDGISMEPGIERATFDYYYGDPRRGSFSIAYMVKNMGGAYGEGAGVEGTETAEERKNLHLWTLRVTSIKPTSYVSSTVEGRIAKFKKTAENKSKYDDLISQADNDLDNGNYADARTKYQSAQRLMPEESYPGSQLEKINELEADAKKKEEEAKKSEEEESKTQSSTRENSTTNTTTQKTQEQLLQEKQEQERQAALERQRKYDEWKAQQDEANSKAAAEAATGMIAALIGIGTIIYGDMGDVDLDKTYTSPSFEVGKYRPTFYHGWEIGLSGTLFPMLFPSVKETMVNGSYVTLTELQGVHAFTVNLEGQFKIGAEADNYGFYGYLYPKIGTSIIFDAFNLSWQNYGGRAFAGLKHAKVYFDYGSGVRQFSYSPLFSTEETGKSKVEQAYTRQEFGLRFTTNPDNASRRTHLSIGIIQETFKVEEDYRYLNPDWYGSPATITGKTKVLTGYAFQWKKDHYFNFYANFYPDFFYSGNTGGAWSDKLINKPTNFFAELGYIKAIDTFKPRKSQ